MGNLFFTEDGVLTDVGGCSRGGSDKEPYQGKSKRIIKA